MTSSLNKIKLTLSLLPSSCNISRVSYACHYIYWTKSSCVKMRLYHFSVQIINHSNYYYTQVCEASLPWECQCWCRAMHCQARPAPVPNGNPTNPHHDNLDVNDFGGNIVVWGHGSALSICLSICNRILLTKKYFLFVVWVGWILWVALICIDNVQSAC